MLLVLGHVWCVDGGGDRYSVCCSRCYDLEKWEQEFRFLPRSNEIEKPEPKGLSLQHARMLVVPQVIYE